MTERIETLPINDGFRMPGEYEAHQSCWLLWPERPDNWRNGGKPAQKVFTEVATEIAKSEPVTVGVNQTQFENARSHLPKHIRVVEMSNDDSWIRDCGATFVKNDKTGEIRGVDWVFNAWGGLVDGLYFPWDKDDQVARKMCDLEGYDYYHTDDFILEGGSIHVDGEGTLITTEECLLNPESGRNFPNLNREEIEQVLKDHLNLQKVIWLPNGIYLDETNGHVDNIACFAKPGEVILAWTDDTSDPQYELSKANLEVLEKETDAKGRKLTVHKIHTPSPILITKDESKGVDQIDGTLPRQEGDRLAASYANFYIGNKIIALPVFNDPKDQDAIELLTKLFPTRKVVPIYAREILLGGGNIHCITQQIPA
ncbi:MAG: agmatine deiminase [Bifidobacteriaceae bacterium]|jgi:agmatine deiminase|nr:agmatine deiminase [Bifidobacteriaceae bacterium]